MYDTPYMDLTVCKSFIKKKLLDLMPNECTLETLVDGFTVHRQHHASEHQFVSYRPAVIVIVQGEKCVKIGSKQLLYGDTSYLVTGVDIPTICALRGASPEKPFLSLSLMLDWGILSQLAVETARHTASRSASSLGAMTPELEPPLLNAFLRLVELVDKPEEAAVLAPLIVREIHYRLLIGPFGDQLRSFNTAGSPGNQIAKTIAWLKNSFREPVTVEELARQANMSSSTFHRHFKEVTALSPLQYQKRLRLAEAQRLMLSEGYDVAGASLAVGYESIPQFTREYKRLFGQPPYRDIVAMKSLFRPPLETREAEACPQA